MPELPEVELARRALEEGVVGRVVADADDADGFVCRPHAVGEIAAALRGRTLTAARRRGKAMWLETDGDRGPRLGLHLGMDPDLGALGPTPARSTGPASGVRSAAGARR